MKKGKIKSGTSMKIQRNAFSFIWRHGFYIWLTLITVYLIITIFLNIWQMKVTLIYINRLLT